MWITLIHTFPLEMELAYLVLTNKYKENGQWWLGAKIVGIGGLHLKRRIRLVIVIVMLLELGDLAILTFLMMNPLSNNSILKQYGLPLGTTTGAMSGRRKKNSGIVSLRDNLLFFIAIIS